MELLKKSFVPVLVLLATCVPGSAWAAGKGITGKEVVAILQDEGYKAKLETDEQGDPIVRTHMAGVSVSVLFYDCKEGRCGSLQFVAGLDLENGTTPAVVNRFNREYRYGSGYLDEENDPFLQFDFEVLHGDHAAHVASQVEIWEDVLSAYLEATGYRDDGDGGERAQAPDEPLRG